MIQVCEYCGEDFQTEQKQDYQQRGVWDAYK